MYIGKLLGAVNGMRPGGTVDKSCLHNILYILLILLYMYIQVSCSVQ